MLQIVHRSSDVESIIIGTFIPLSPDEDRTLNCLIFSGLGFGLDRDMRVKHKDIGKPSTSASTTSKTTMTEPECELKISVKSQPDELKLILHKLEVKPGELIHITDELLDSIPSTPYSEATRRLMQTSNVSNELDYSSDTTIPYSDNTSRKSIVNRRRISKRICPPVNPTYDAAHITSNSRCMVFGGTMCATTLTGAKWQTVIESSRMLVIGTAIIACDKAHCSNVRPSISLLHHRAPSEITSTCIVTINTNACSATAHSPS